MQEAYLELTNKNTTVVGDKVYRFDQKITGFSSYNCRCALIEHEVDLKKVRGIIVGCAENKGIINGKNATYVLERSGNVWPSKEVSLSGINTLVDLTFLGPDGEPAVPGEWRIILHLIPK